MNTPVAQYDPLSSSAVEYMNLAQELTGDLP
jgi:hypothetical protein